MKKEEAKVRNAIFTLKQFCDKFDDCDDCWLHEILKGYGICPVAELNEAAKEWENET